MMSEKRRLHHARMSAQSPMRPDTAQAAGGGVGDVFRFSGSHKKSSRARHAGRRGEHARLTKPPNAPVLIEVPIPSLRLLADAEVAELRAPGRVQTRARRERNAAKHLTEFRRANRGEGLLGRQRRRGELVGECKPGRRVLRTGFFDQMPAFYLRVIETSQLNHSVRDTSNSLQRNHDDECS
jgi:hypothetical protein